jgi:hypothetical protein
MVSLPFAHRLGQSRFRAAAIAFFSLTAFSHADIIINLTAKTLADGDGVPLSPNAMIQLINLGPDGIFNPISLSDGSTTGLAYWVSGDDSVVDIPFYRDNGTPGDFPSTAAFDLFDGPGTPGTLSRQMFFDGQFLPKDTKLGIRWFPYIDAADFPDVTLPPPLPLGGLPYGQFTRQSDPLYSEFNGEIWVVPIDGASIFFDPLITVDHGVGEDPIAAGMAAIPEPASATLALLGAATFFHLRRRR